MLLLTAVGVAPAQFYYQINPDSGLTLSLDGVPIVRGSWFQYYAPGWSKGYFSSTSHPAKITQIDAKTVLAAWISEDGLSTATETLTRTEGKLHIHYDFNWGGDAPAKLELTAGALWGPAISSGTLLNSGKATRSLAPMKYNSQSWGARRYGDDATNYELRLPFGNVQLSSTEPLTLLDGRDDFKQDWAEGKDLLWLGAEALTVEKGKPTTVDFDWQFDTPSAPAAPIVPNVKVSAEADPAAYDVPEVHPPLIPQPKKNSLDWDHPLEITGTWAFPAGRFAHVDEFEQAIARRFIIPKAGKPINIDGGISKLGLTPGAYRITITPKGISVVGEKDEGFRYGLQRIARLAFVKDGKLYVPTGDLSDEPVNAFRGVHLFVGPKSLDFQRKLVERVLMPLGMNRVVLECERAAWKSLPGIETSDTMSLDQLAELFKMYRNYDFEPIPLIESFGHDEWLFANGKNLDVAMDPKTPYALDPRKPRTKELLDGLWDEAIKLLQPETVHFGLDEVDMEGFPADAATKTALWKTQLGTLGDIAKNHGVKMILWGDELLGPEEAADATNGDTAADAAARRAAVPAGAMIADWHYLADSDPARFMPSLSLFAREGFKPIAATWYKPENIRGFDLAAISGGFGTLQTTWAGSTSSEDGMIAAFNQFSAMVLAADYGWSGRQDELKDLDYDYSEVFKQMYFGHPVAIGVMPGKTFAVGVTTSARIGSVDFRLGAPIQLRSNATISGAGLPQAASIPMDVTAKHLAVALGALLPSEDGETIGDLEVTFENGKTVVQHLLYGQQVRARTDPKTCLYVDRKDGVSSFVFDFDPVPASIRRVRLLQINQYSGLQILGLTAY
jgi:hexosaminidase